MVRSTVDSMQLNNELVVRSALFIFFKLMGVIIDVGDVGVLFFAISLFTFAEFRLALFSY